MDVDNLRWWGWGTLDQAYDLEDRLAFWPALQKWLDLPDEALEREIPPVPLEEISLRPPRLDDPVLSSLRKLLGEEAVRTDVLARIAHAYGKSYHDLIRIRAGHVPNPPDAVVYPAEQCKVAAFLAWAAERDIAVVPFGGGSSILGGVEPLPGDRLTITLDLAKLDRVLSIDTLSRVARIQAGATGPRIEVELNARGFTLGHFPLSFEFSTLGGWIATRSVGQHSIGYGRIESMARSVRVVMPVGVAEARGATVTAAGPSLLQLLIGSEGTYGVIAEAAMRIHPLPEVRDCRGILFHSLEDGAAACRELVQSAELRPSLVRLSDAAESAAHAVLERSHRGLRRLADNLLGRLGKSATNDLLMLIEFAGDTGWVTRQWNRALELCQDHHAVSLGRMVGQSWVRDRFIQPYLRDVLLDHGIMVDTVEATTTWSNVAQLYEAVKTAVQGAISGTGGGPGYVMVHFSNADVHGATLYATFLGRQVDDPGPLARQQQWQEIVQATADAVEAAGGTLAPHHGVERKGPLWLDDEVGPLGTQSLQALKQTFDPDGIMNPGLSISLPIGENDP